VIEVSNENFDSNNWDGEDTHFSLLEEGFYTIKITAYDSNNQELTYEDYESGETKPVESSSKFLSIDMWDFLKGVDASMGFLGDVQFLLAMSYSIPSAAKLGYDIAIIIAATTLKILVSIAYPPCYSEFLGLIAGSLLGTTIIALNTWRVNNAWKFSDNIAEDAFLSIINVMSGTGLHKSVIRAFTIGGTLFSLILLILLGIDNIVGDELPNTSEFLNEIFGMDTIRMGGIITLFISSELAYKMTLRAPKDFYFTPQMVLVKTGLLMSLIFLGLLYIYYGPLLLWFYLT